MASVVVDGLVLPIPVAGHPALDFVNTRAGWGQPRPKEYLHTHAHLSLWARENGLVEPATAAALRRRGEADPGAGAAVVARALAFRDAVHDLLVGPPAAAAWAAVNSEVRRAGARATLRPAESRAGGHTGSRAESRTESRAGGRAAGRVGPRLPAAWAVDPDGIDAPLLAVVWSAAGLLTSPSAAGVAACPGAGCGWVFADPRGRRRWCSMAWCGNRAKARRHAERRRDARN